MQEAIVLKKYSSLLKKGVTLTDEQLEAVSGGCGRKIPNCPVCGSSNVHMNLLEANTKDYFTCRDCDHHWYA